MGIGNLTISNVYYAKRTSSTWYTDSNRIVAGYITSQEDSNKYWYVSRIKVTVPSSLNNKVVTKISVKAPLSGDSRVYGTRAVLSTSELAPASTQDCSGVMNASPKYYKNSVLTDYPSGWSSNIDNAHPYFVFTLSSNITLSTNGVYYIYFYSTNSSEGDDRTAFHGISGTSNYTVEVTYLDTFTVTFNANGGSVSTSSKTVTNGSTYGTLPTPNKTGNRFNGWYTSTSGGTKITSSSTVSLTTNQTLYAQWTPYVLTLKYHPNGGTFTNTEYTYEDDGTFVYTAGYGSGCSSNSTLYNVETFGSLRNGYHINTGLEWNSKADGSGTPFNHSTNYGNAEDLATLLGLDLTSGDKSATIYVNWKANTLTIWYNANGSKFTLDPETQSTMNTARYPSVGSYDSLYMHGSLLSDTNLDTDKVVGKHLEDDLEWNTKQDGSGTSFSFSEGFQVTQGLADYLGLDMSSGNTEIELYLNWKTNKYTVNIENAEVDQDQFVIEHGKRTQLYATLGKRTGYTFTGFTTDIGEITDNLWLDVDEDIEHNSIITVTGNWKENTGIIHLHDNGGTPLQTIDTIRFSYTNSMITVPQVSQLFQKVFYHIEYDATSWLIGEPTYNNNIIDSSQLVSHRWLPTHNEKYPDPQESYPQFINPNLETNLQTYLADGDCTIDLYPNWTYNTLTIKYVLSNPNEVPYEENSVHESKYVYSDRLALYYPDDEVLEWAPQGSDKPVGYNLNTENWCVTNSDHGQVLDIASNNGIYACNLSEVYTQGLNMQYEPSITVILYPSWEKEQYTITYDSRGGSDVGLTTALYDTSTPISDVIPTLDGYSFIGWSTSQDDTVEYYPGNNIIISGQEPSDVVLYAVWVTTSGIVGNTCFIKVGGVWKPGQLFSKDTTWKNVSIFTKSNGVYD